MLLVRWAPGLCIDVRSSLCPSLSSSPWPQTLEPTSGLAPWDRGAGQRQWDTEMMPGPDPQQHTQTCVERPESSILAVAGAWGQGDHGPCLPDSRTAPISSRPAPKVHKPPSSPTCHFEGEGEGEKMKTKPNKPPKTLLGNLSSIKY